MMGAVALVLLVVWRGPAILEHYPDRFRAVALRLLGGRAYWPYGLEQIAHRCRQAGIPLALSFDPDTAEFNYRYTPRTADGPTEIFVPVALHYPDGYVVDVSGATVTSAANAPRLLLENQPDATEVTVTVTRTAL